MNIESVAEDIYNQFQQLLNKYFPDLSFRYMGYAGMNFHAILASENKMYRNTPYFYNGEFKFIHWTSVNNLLSILNNREIRLYNLYNSDDADEFCYAANVLGLEDSQIAHLKKNYYTFSFSKKEELNNDYLWKKYGGDHKGVAIEFSIENDPLEWNNFMISNVHYNVPIHFSEFAEDILKLRDKSGADFKGLNIGKLIGFHKKNNFLNEKEVRIATYFPFKNLEEYLKFSKPEFRIDSIRNRMTEYISLPLWVNNEASLLKSNMPDFSLMSSFNSDNFKTIPQIKIQNIYFGEDCGLTNSEFYSYRQKLFDIIRFNYGYKLDLDLNLCKRK